ncbi:DUF2489 domain-containing protein [Marinomonas mediterranea]|uniref:DUF2489 domain-containing protein n=1 Tax=Marinomonas mediterranea TaxID=119864 RepID=UPI00234AAD2D|nr:DUF2489 domain-containing protein [Marinomonas mediterranea]WCN12122.1 DUF2489 domain-containing protein [Marinomonas mediterranea]
MSTLSFVVALVVSVIVIMVSIGVILRQLKKNKLRKEKIAEGEKRVADERAKRVESIQVILQAVKNDENLTWIEASIRIKNLLDQLSLDLSEHETIKAFYAVEEETQHIPTHEQWRELPIKARMSFLKEMDDVEAKHKSTLEEARLALLAFPLE